ncbi:MAG: AsmA-like C-terminal region-containing protein [Planctomycetota bacterium]
MSRKRILLLYFGFVTALLVTTWIVLGRTGVSRTFVANLLARVIRPEHFKLRDAAVDLGGGIVTLRGLEVSTPAEQPGRARMAVEQVDVGVETNPLGEPGRVREVRMRGLDLEIDLAEGRFPDLGRLLETSADNGTDRGMDAPPPLTVTESRLRLRMEPDAPAIDFKQLEFQLLPIQAGSSVMILKGSMRGPGGDLFELDGRADVAKPEVAAKLRLAGTALTPEFITPYNRLAGEFAADIGATGRIDQLEVWARYPRPHDGNDTAPDELAAGLRLDLGAINCLVPQFPYPIQGASAHLTADLRERGSMRFEFDQHGDDGSIRVAGELHDLLATAPIGEFRVEVRDVVVDPRIGRALARIDDARNVWEAFSPTAGRADAEIRLELGGAGTRPTFSMDLDVRDAAVKFVGFVGRDGTRLDGFPLPLRDVKGRIQVRDEEVVIPQVDGRLDEGPVSIRGRIGKSDGDHSLRLSVWSDDLLMSPALATALGSFDPGITTTVAEYAPEGRTACTIDIATRTGGDDHLKVGLRPRAASASWAGFPARVEAIEGSIDIDDEQVALDLHGRRGEVPIALSGRFAIGGRPPAEHEPRAELVLRTGPLRIDDELRHAMHVLSPTLGDNVDRFDLQGSVGVTLTTWHLQGHEAFEYDVRADLGAARATFALPVQDILGPVFVQGSGERAHVELSGVRGRIVHETGAAPSSVLVQGSIETDTSGQQLDLTAVVRELPLDEQLGAALDRMHALDLDTWHVLAPSGRIDLVWRHTKSKTAGDDHQSMRVQLSDVGSDASFLPAPALSVYGDLEIRDGVTTLSELRGRMADAEFSITGGTIAHTGDCTDLQLTVTSDSFPVDDRLANLLSGPMRDTYLARHLLGRVAFRELKLEMKLPDTSDGFETRLSGRIVASKVSATIGAELREFDGMLAVDDAHFDLGGGKVRGSVQDAAFTLFGHRAEDVDAAFEADVAQIAFHSIHGKLHGGEFRGAGTDGRDLVYEFDGPGKLSFGLAWTGIDLARLMRAAGARDRRFRGELAGKFQIDELRGVDVVDMRGSGDLRISSGDLGAVPVFTAIYSYLLEPRRPRFDNLTTKLRIEGRRVFVDELAMSSPLLTATGKGSFDMAGWVDMRIDFPDLFGREGDWILIPALMRAMTSTLVQFQVHGLLRNPQTRPLWIGREAAGDVPLEPLPSSESLRR